MPRYTKNENMTEYYHFYRLLIFKKQVILIRNNILDELNASIEKAGKSIGFDCKIVTKGLKNPNDVDEIIKRLREGKIKFNEIVDFLFDNETK